MVKKKKSNISVKTQLFVATGTVLLLVAFGLFVGWLDSSAGMKLIGKTKTVSFSDVTLKGKPTCLEHKNSDGPTTLECAQGLKTVNGTVYAIEGGTMLSGSDQFELTGTLKSADPSSKYKSAGTIVVK
jgi:hypothetical protein